MFKSRNKPKVFVDADVIFAGVAAPSEHGAGASHVVLRMGEITLIDCISSEQAVKLSGLVANMFCHRMQKIYC